MESKLTVIDIIVLPIPYGVGNNVFVYNSNNLFSVDFSHCGLTKVSRVITWMTCKTKCWTVTGSDKIYNLTNDSFRVYLYHVPPKTTPVNDKGYPLRANIAQDWEYELHYEVKGICNNIPIE